MTLALEPQPRRGRAVDHEIGFETLLLLVGIDVGEFRQFLHRRRDLGGPRIDLGAVVTLERVLVFGTAGPSAGADILHRLQKQPRPGIFAILPLSRAMTWKTLCLRSANGFSLTKTKPSSSARRR